MGDQAFEPAPVDEAATLPGILTWTNLSKITMPLLAVHTASLRCGALPAPISLLCGSGLQQDSNKQILVGKGIADLPNLW